MFHFDVTCEDCRLIATESGQDKHAVDVLLLDNQSGKTHRLLGISFCQVEKLISGMICCQGDVPAEEYPELEAILEGCPVECRPIP